MQKSTIKKLLIIAAIILSPILYWQIKYPSYTYRYKMIVEVETPQGIKSGSSVVEVHTDQWPYWMSLGSGNTGVMKIKGEGTIVDIADGKTLFVLLNGAPAEGNPYALIYSAIPIPKGYGRYDKFYGTLKNAKGILPKDKYPIIVSAVQNQDRNIKFTIVNPEQSENGHIKFTTVDPEKLKEAFGNEIKIKQIVVETTNDPVEWKMKKLPIWNEVINYRDEMAKDGIYLDFSTLTK